MKIKVSLNQIINFNKLIVKNTNDSFGVITTSPIEFALSQINYNNIEIYFYRNLALLIRNIIGQHPFLDGNKRTGLFVVELILNSHNLKLKLTIKEKENFVLKVAKGKFNDLDKLSIFIESNTKSFRIS